MKVCNKMMPTCSALCTVACYSTITVSKSYAVAIGDVLSLMFLLYFVPDKLPFYSDYVS